MVIFQTPDGNPGYNQFETIEEAVRFVEVLRNEQSVENARIFALEEVKFEFKPYFRVELDPPMLNAGTEAQRPAAAAPAPSATPSSASGSSASTSGPSSTAPVTTPAANGAGATATPPQAPAPISEPPASAFAPPSAQSSESPSSERSDEPTRREPSPVGNEQPVSSVPPPTFMAGASTPTGTDQQPATTRRGLFGR